MIINLKSYRTIRTIALRFVILTTALTVFSNANAQTKTVAKPDLKKLFQSPPEAAKPWVFWYWLQGAVSKEGVTKDLEAMKEVGLGGAYLMPIKGPNPAYTDHPVVQLTPEWWAMVKHAMNESKRLNFKLAMHVSDGFALAGGPWITPKLSMQKVVWTEKQITGGKQFNDILQQPETNEGYYKDIAVFAYRSPAGAGVSTRTIVPKVTSSKPDSAASLLAVGGNKKTFNCDEQCWVQYEFQQPFTCRSIIIHSRNNYEANRLIVEASDDGKNFTSIERLEPPRSGWQDWDADYTHDIKPTTARYFRFSYDKAGSEPGAEDLDAAKWKQSLKITGIELSSEPRIHQYEGKNGEVWRIAKRTTTEQLPDNLCVPLKGIIDITKYLDAKGRLVWNVPAGNWTLLRIGQTSTGHRNDTGGGGKGLECDKFNPAAIKLQFDNWYGQIYKQVGEELSKQVLSIFHVDSWECGSQNWSTVFRDEFKKRRGYDLYPYLPVMTGVPVESANVSERFLYDVRQTIAELINDKFFATLANLAHAKGVKFSAESVAPTMLSDGMLHYQNADLPMGEFWLRSPTHDKPNDMLDAISGAHIYGKQIVQAEAFTELRLAWDENPAMLKPVQDRNYALGINRFVYHVFMHNPWTDRKPGMTLDGIGLFFQRDQTWWKPGREWVKYAQRCQALLQVGKPFVDVAVFTGEELPRRSVLPDRLVSTLPGIFGNDVVESEAKRLANVGEPLRVIPSGVTSSANMADPEKWIDPLRGYAYDSYNPDALIRLSKVRNGRIELPGGASFKLLVLPGVAKMNPNGNMMSKEVATKLKQLIQDGATVLINDKPEASIGLLNNKANDKEIAEFEKNVYTTAPLATLKKIGKGQVLYGPYKESSFDKLGLQRDFVATNAQGKPERDIAWTHRTSRGIDIYFISNQKDEARTFEVSLRVGGRIPELWNPVTGQVVNAGTWRFEKGRTVLAIRLEANGSMFIVLQQPTTLKSQAVAKNWIEPNPLQTINTTWSVTFDKNLGGPDKPVTFNKLTDWTANEDTAIRYYSGTASYTTTFEYNHTNANPSSVWLSLGKVANIAEVTLNGINCGVAWTPPYAIDITKALRPGKNNLTINVTNTWANRIMRDKELPESMRITKTNDPYKLVGKTALTAGLLGPVVIEEKK
jgi:hypothetical protein